MSLFLFSFMFCFCFCFCFFSFFVAVVAAHSSKSRRHRPRKSFLTLTRAACGAGQMLRLLRPELRRVASPSTHPWRSRRTELPIDLPETQVDVTSLYFFLDFFYSFTLFCLISLSFLASLPAPTHFPQQQATHRRNVPCTVVTM
ncbi:hypothetical protein LX36DRAFT_268774 [Colletotrichum falcatum]|nr:hypothetical protein LX36DRAFT_268774 [Colletotrichum falcatum]